MNFPDLFVAIIYRQRFIKVDFFNLFLEALIRFQNLDG